MSGGSFNYAYSRVNDFADDLLAKIDENWKPDRDGCISGMPPFVIDELTAMVSEARQLAARMRAAEWLYSHDIGPETFMKWVAESRK